LHALRFGFLYQPQGPTRRLLARNAAFNRGSGANRTFLSFITTAMLSKPSRKKFQREIV
jgi:hypothetical protein